MTWFPLFQPETKTTNKMLNLVTTHLAYLLPRSKKISGGAEDIAGEYQSIMEQEYLDFVLFEVPWIVS